ncbi:MAG: ferrochelatase [Planctomycetota bacterium]
MPHYDALLVLSFGGPEGPDDVMPFLENVTRGRNVPRERLLEVAEHYMAFDGVSPINDEMRALVRAIVDDLRAHGLGLPVYWANRFWHPLLPEVLEQMREDGVERALAFATSAFGSYSGCRAYSEDIEAARATLPGPAPAVDKLRLFYNHPGFIEPMADRVWDAFETIPADRRAGARLIFTAHSVPEAMAETSPYERQLHEACRLVAERLRRDDWRLAYQSRSGPPSQAWLAPAVEDLLREAAVTGVQDVVLAPIGFLTDHMEVVYDLDVEARGLCEELGIAMARAGTVGSHPRFVQMVRELVQERLDPATPRLALGKEGPWPDACPPGCCRRD